MGKVIDKQYKDYSHLSRYSAFPYYYNVEDDKYIYGTTAQLDSTTPYLLHICKDGDSFDSLALTYYGTPLYYWVICDFNRIQDPFIKLEKGRELKIPTITNIKFDL